jgi:hypothetical protein
MLYFLYSTTAMMQCSFQEKGRRKEIEVGINIRKKMTIETKIL